MNKNQLLALVIAAANVAIMLLFPPFDTYSIAAAKFPVFGGFDFYFRLAPGAVVNSAMLSLEIFVVLINAGIVWLLLGAKKAAGARRRLSLQNATLIVVAINLVVILLFPPFESVFAVTRAALPTFEGFYFIFARQSHHVLVTTILYLEVFFVVINGAIFWLMFRARDQERLTPEQALKLMQELRKSGG